MKMFVVEKYVMAEDILDALKREKKVSVDNVYVEQDWKRCFIDKRLFPTERVEGFKKNEKTKTKSPKKS